MARKIQLLLVVSVVALTGAGGAPAQDLEIVLRVNERIATSYDYLRRRNENVRRIQSSQALSEEQRQEMLASIGTMTMSEIFEELLMLSRADQLNIQASRDEIDRQLETTRSSFGLETQEEFEQALAASGLTAEELRLNLGRSIALQKLMSEEIQPRISLEEEDLRRFYQTHSDEFQVPERLLLQEIVILEESALELPEQQRVAAELRTILQEETAPEEALRAFEERGVASGLVDLGWIEAGDLDRDLEKAVWGLTAGEVSEPVAGRGGLHLLRVKEREEARLLPFAEVQEQIANRERDRLFGAEMQKYLKELEAQSYIVANPPAEAAGFRASLDVPGARDALEEALTAPLVVEPRDEEELPADEGADAPSEGDQNPPNPA